MESKGKKIQSIWSSISASASERASSLSQSTASRHCESRSQAERLTAFTATHYYYLCQFESEGVAERESACRQEELEQPKQQRRRGKAPC